LVLLETTAARATLSMLSLLADQCEVDAGGVCFFNGSLP
jgi:hypothetical protein